MRQINYIRLLSCCIILLWSCQTIAQNKEKEDFAVHKTTAQWKNTLTPKQYYVLRERGTERPFSSPLLHVTAPGVMVCGACGNPLFYAKNKFQSSCGWPSFDRVIKGAVHYKKDYRLGMVRTEVICAKCGSHLGHVFNDGPKETTGKRYCINGVALKFIPNKKK